MAKIPNEVYAKMTVEQRLNMVNYDFEGYIPSDEALFFVNFIKEVNGGEEENETPVVHLAMMDDVFNGKHKCAVLCHRGIGKRQPSYSKIRTPDGWTTMGEVMVGDDVINRYGKSTKVIYKTPEITKPVYRITLSDNSFFDVDEEHNNIVWMYRKKERERVLTTKELMNRPLYIEKTNRNNSRSPKRQYMYSIPLAEPIETAYVKQDIDPYLMGIMIANGHFGTGTLSCHLDDIVEINKIISDIGHVTKRIRKMSDNGGRIEMSKIPFNKYKDCVFKKKYIPNEFMNGSIEQRLSLLQGLMDGDGSISENGRCRFHTLNIELAEQVVELTRSLGSISYIKKYNRLDKINSYEEYVVVINIKMNPFRLNRKSSKWKATKKTSRAITSIELIGEYAGHCIAVCSSDHSYITDSYVVTHNTTLFAEYLILFIAAFGRFPGFGKVNLMLYITDSIENGVKNLRRNVEFRYSNSDFLKKLIPNKKIKVGNYDTSQWVDMSEFDEHSSSNGGGIKFTDIRLEFENNKGHKLVVKGYGARALSLDTILHTKQGTTTISECSIGDNIIGSDGKECKIVDKSIVFMKPMYEITLKYGRKIKVSEDHINSVVIKTNHHNTAKYVKQDLTTNELLELPLFLNRNRTKYKSDMQYVSSENLIFIRNCEAVEYDEKEFNIEPYTLGLLLGNGSMKKDGSCVITAETKDMDEYLKYIGHSLGSDYMDKRNNHVRSLAIKGISAYIRELELAVHGDNKFIPEIYKYGSIKQRIELLSGLMDIDGTISKTGRMVYSSNSYRLVKDVEHLVLSLGGNAHIIKQKDRNHYKCEIWTDICPFKLERKRERYSAKKYRGIEAIVSIEPIELEPSQCIAVNNDSHQFIVNDFVVTHNTGVRGAKEMGQRPSIALMDDLLSDEDSRSPTIISSIEDTIYKAVSKALHPTRQKMVWLGTPFNQKDPLYKAVESGAWNVSCYPVCEWFDENTTKETFKGSWADRFPYEYVKREFEEAKALGRLHDFYQELMLRIMSEDERLVLDSDITWYSRADVLKNKDRYNWYITTDFATSEKTSADYSVISVWAYNNNADWLWVDGIVKRQLMDKNVNDLFKFVQKYKPMSVGIEISGQQSGFVAWVKNEMINKNIFFNLARNEGSTKDGLMPNTNKLMRFNTVVPLFKAGKIWLPTELKDDETMKEAMNEIRGASMSGFKSKHDDWLDTVSMLPLMNAFRPSVEVEYRSRKDDDGIYIDIEPDEENSWTGKSTIF